MVKRYDAASNLSSITAGGSTQNFTYMSTNSITSGSYDADGDPTSLGANGYTWDGANRIISFAGAGNKNRKCSAVEHLSTGKSSKAQHSNEFAESRNSNGMGVLFPGASATNRSARRMTCVTAD
jgi:hypothetical protein